MCKWHGFSFTFPQPRDLAHGDRSWIDIFLLDAVVREAVESHRRKLRCWRFHRVADYSRLCCYTAPASAREIDASIRATNVPSVLSALCTYAGPELATNIAPKEGIEQTCLDLQPPVIQELWPPFAQAVSELLVEMIGRLRCGGRPAIDPANMAKIEHFYKAIDKRLNTEVWSPGGCHAFFHHIHALFGYAPFRAWLQFDHQDVGVQGVFVVRDIRGVNVVDAQKS